MPFEGQFFRSWLKKMGVSRTTGWRWIQQGRVKVVGIYGRKYITNEEIERFFREGAEFKGKKPPIPTRKSQR